MVQPTKKRPRPQKVWHAAEPRGSHMSVESVRRSIHAEALRTWRIEEAEKEGKKSK
jgi:hypothetical protein